MLESLRQRNQQLIKDLDSLLEIVNSAQIVRELERYRERLQRICNEERREAERNLALIGFGLPELEDDILSRTSVVIRYVRLLSFRFIRPLFRASLLDRVCLLTIQWLHQQDGRTRDYPAVYVDDDCGISPFIHIAPMYFFPCLEQRGLLFQPLFFHEFGHLLYLCHEREMNDLVADLQRELESALIPLSQRNDRHSEAQAMALQQVVDAWYKWIQELFCDAVGLTIGGPSFLESFSEYLMRLQPGDFYRPASELAGSSHPVTWLRIQLLADRARAQGMAGLAEQVENAWRDCCSGLGVVEDYHGFYESGFRDIIHSAIDDMLTEGSPRECSAEERVGLGWEQGPRSLVALLNEAWIRCRKDLDGFEGWQRGIMQEFYRSP